MAATNTPTDKELDEIERQIRAGHGAWLRPDLVQSWSGAAADAIAALRLKLAVLRAPVTSEEVRSAMDVLRASKLTMDQHAALYDLIERLARELAEARAQIAYEQKNALDNINMAANVLAAANARAEVAEKKLRDIFPVMYRHSPSACCLWY
jgi:hypothetical protein